ncbi:MAG: TetR/AcrR family transcriptional regulator [Deltaproteobacteria bacterium]|nr:TetR/AcrR family transcriptional regulator [Deltaproteobacteria bacterium]
MVDTYHLIGRQLPIHTDLMDVRTQILHSATRLFAAHGFDGTSLKDIADAVGIRKPSLLYHFPSKEKLRLAVLEQLLERWNDVLPRLLMVAAGGEPRFETIIDEVVGFFTADPDRARLLVREILDRPADMRDRLDTYVRPWVDVVAKYIRKGQEFGEVHADVDPEAYVLQVINLVLSGVAAAASLAGGLLPQDSPLGDPAKRHARELIRIARYSLFRSPDVGAPRASGGGAARSDEPEADAQLGKRQPEG